MRVFKLLLLLMFALFTLLPAKEARLMHYPDIYGNKVVFSYAGDLWEADITDGMAVRLTSHPGNETAPHFSPDGRRIAFTAEYDGNTDVYVMPASGGEPLRLTYHGGRDQAVGWSPDGQKVLFASYRETGYTGPFLYEVDLNGGYPQKLPIDRAAWASFSPNGKQVAFNRRGGEFRNWKRYHGGEAQDVWIGDPQTKTFRNITADYTGIDQRPLWIGDEIYFVSDRRTNVNNLWAYNVKSGQFIQKTHFKNFAVYAPETDGKSVVFEHGGYLYRYGVADGKLQQLHITVPSDDWRNRPAFVNPARHLGQFDVTPNGKQAVVDARGDLYKISQKSGKWLNLTDTQGVREHYPAISPDGKYVAYFSDASGDYQLYIRELTRDAKPVQLTHTLKTYPYHPVWSPDSRKLLFGDKDYILRVVDVSNGKMREIDRGHYQKDYEFYWEISEYDWSPDSKWVAYSKVQPNLNSAIYLYSLDQNRVYQVTDGELDDFYPSFDKNGKYLYFLSNRNFQPALDPSEDNFIISKMTKVCLVQLRAGEKPPFAKEDDEPEKKATAQDSGFRIDLKGIGRRIYTVPIQPGHYKKLQGGRNAVFAMGKERFGFPGIEEFFNPGSVQDYFINGLDMKKQKEVRVIDRCGDFRVSADGKSLIYRSGETVGIVDVGTLAEHKAGDGKLKLSKLEMKLDRRAEWHQIFNEIWRWYRDFFYDPHMHGVNWQQIHDEYLPLVDAVGTRDELNRLVSEMVGEICASHMYIFGGDRDTGFRMKRIGTGLLGADIQPDAVKGLYRITKIYRGKSWDKSLRGPLAAPDIDVREGDYLLAIDGHKLNIRENYLKYLVNKAGKDVQITVASPAKKLTERTYTVKPVRSERGLRRWEWVKTRAEMVREASGGKIGYIHMDDMDEEGLAQFEEGWKANKYKPGLILDVRYNGGGFTNYFVIDKLERKLVFGAKTRDFAPMRFPMAVSNAKMATLINEFTGSDGELFTEHFKARKLGKVIGTRTWGGLIGIINSTQTVDGGIAVQPNVGFYNFQGKWIVENHGAEADPGLDIDITPADGLQGKDPQLQKAIDLLMEEIGQDPPKFPGPPAFPPKKP